MEEIKSALTPEELAAAANKWHEENMTSPAYTASMKRYFEISKATPHTSILSLREGKISHFDELFKKYASEIDWDWRLLASLAYTESNFDTFFNITHDFLEYNNLS